MTFKKLITIICVFLLFALPVWAQEVPEEQSAQQELSFQESEQQSEEQILAKVNGENIFREELQQKTNLQLINQQLFQIDQKFAQFLNYSEAGQQFLQEYNRYILEDLIGEVLLQQEAKRMGIEVTEQDEDHYFEQHINTIKEQQGLSEEEILEVLQQQNVESLKQYQEIFVENTNLLVQKLTDQEIASDIEITDEMAKQVYEQNKGQFADQAGNVTPFEDIKEQLKAQLMQQEEANLLEEFTKELREEAEIEILF
jgi:peptidyl-prolyl cis-trans isomerase SurA